MKTEFLAGSVWYLPTWYFPHSAEQRDWLAGSRLHLVDVAVQRLRAKIDRVDVLESAEDLLRLTRAETMPAFAKAVELDPGLADGYWARGNLRASVTWDWEGAQTDFRKALALDPAARGEMREFGGSTLSEWNAQLVHATVNAVPQAGQTKPPGQRGSPRLRSIASRREAVAPPGAGATSLNTPVSVTMVSDCAFTLTRRSPFGMRSPGWIGHKRSPNRTVTVFGAIDSIRQSARGITPAEASSAE